MFCVLPENKGMGTTVDWRVVIGRAPRGMVAAYLCVTGHGVGVRQGDVVSGCTTGAAWRAEASVARANRRMDSTDHLYRGDNMKQCAHCRFGNPEDAKFCRRAAERSGTR